MNFKSIMKQCVPSSPVEVAFVVGGTTAMVGLYVVTATSLASVVVAGTVTAGALCVLCGCSKTLDELKA